jgi:hypothetical protein
MEIMIQFHDEQKSSKAIKNLKEYGVLPEIFSTKFIEEGKLILAMTDHDPDKRPDVREVLINFLLIDQFRCTFREHNGDLDEESFISCKIVDCKDRGVFHQPLIFNAMIMSKFGNFDNRLDFEEGFLGKCSFGNVTLRRYKDGTQLAIKKIVLKKFDEKKIDKLLSDVVHIAKRSLMQRLGCQKCKDQLYIFVLTSI